MLKKITYVLLIVIPYCVSAEMYKWVDDDGNTHYSQSPPSDKKVEVIKPPPKVDTESAIKELKQRQENFKKQDEEKLKAEKEQNKIAEDLALKEKNCSLSRSRLQSLQNSGRIRAVDEQGNISRASEEERQARIKESAANVEEYCN